MQTLYDLYRPCTDLCMTCADLEQTLYDLCVPCTDLVQTLHRPCMISRGMRWRTSSPNKVPWHAPRAQLARPRCELPGLNHWFTWMARRPLIPPHLNLSDAATDPIRSPELSPPSTSPRAHPPTECIYGVPFLLDRTLYDLTLYRPCTDLCRPCRDLVQTCADLVQSLYDLCRPCTILVGPVQTLYRT